MSNETSGLPKSGPAEMKGLDGCSLVREVKLSYGRATKIESVSSPKDVASFVRKRLGANPDREHMIMIAVDARSHPLGWRVVSIGTVGQSLVHPREVFRPAIAMGAVAVAVAHVHPSGDPNPSREDEDVTVRLKGAGQLLGIPLLDHVVVGNPGHYSYREKGQL